MLLGGGSGMCTLYGAGMKATTPGLPDGFDDYWHGDLGYPGNTAITQASGEVTQTCAVKNNVQPPGERATAPAPHSPSPQTHTHTRTRAHTHTWVAGNANISLAKCW